MTVTLISLEQRFDPGFTVCLTVSANDAQYHIRGKDGVITAPADVPDYWQTWKGDRKTLCADCRSGRMVAAAAFMAHIAHAEQFRCGWRIAAVA